MGNTRDETCRRGTVTAAFREHLMQRAPRQPALQHSVSRGMAERHARKTIRFALKAADGPSQGRKRVHAYAGHAPFLEIRVRHSHRIERMTDLFVHDMF